MQLEFLKIKLHLHSVDSFVVAGHIFGINRKFFMCCLKVPTKSQTYSHFLPIIACKYMYTCIDTKKGSEHPSGAISKAQLPEGHCNKGTETAFLVWLPAVQAAMLGPLGLPLCSVVAALPGTPLYSQVAVSHL